MDIFDAVVAIGFMGTCISSVWLYVNYGAKVSRELEELKHENLMTRAQTRPKEWWQEVLVNLSSNPEVISKLLPLVGNVNLQGIVQQALQNQLKR